MRVLLVIRGYETRFATPGVHSLIRFHSLSYLQASAVYPVSAGDLQGTKGGFSVSSASAKEGDTEAVSETSQPTGISESGANDVASMS